ncbi:unnamed protein product [Cyclocybe aegerita]|uniref:Uncharacterized protein n=1 Tax=Cyclocybe aegerita TaxID=1973307 RepID=A0A8S0XE56_CYCAE|nr:unnamed protein product [Cyclocybe aegerita]
MTSSTLHRCVYLCLVASSVFIGQVGGASDSADILMGRIHWLEELGGNAILPRQTGNPLPNVPPQCTATCNPVNTVLAAGCPISQCCQASFATGYYNCFLCVEGALGINDFTVAQGIVDNLVTTCASRGFAIPKLTFPGQNPDRPLSTAIATTASIRSTTSQVGVTTAVSTTSTQITQSTVTQSSISPTTPAPVATTTTSAGRRNSVGCLLFIFGVLTAMVAWPE